MSIEHSYESLRCRYRDYLCAATDTPDISVTVTAEDISAERSMSAFGQLQDADHEFVAAYRKISAELPRFDTLLFHSSVMVAHDGCAYAFAGKSGAGKSTHSKLWAEHHGAVFLNGDKPLYRLENGSFYVYGTPYMGKEGLGYRGRAKLCGLCFVEQSLTNSISAVSPENAAQLIMRQTIIPYHSPECTARVLELLDMMTKSVPLWRLCCDISREAAQLSYDKMVKGNKE